MHKGEDRQSPTSKYLKDRKKINLVGSLRGAQPPLDMCPKCNIGKLSYSQHDEKGDRYLICNNFPLCKHTQLSNITTKQPQGRTSSSKVQQKYGQEQQGKLFIHSFGSRGKNRSKKGIDDDDIWNLIGSKGTVVSQGTFVYNSDSGWERRD